MEAAVRGVPALLQGVKRTAGRFSVVVPALVRNAEDLDNLARCVMALALADPAPDEIIVVDDGSATAVSLTTVGTVALRILRQQNAGPAGARNAGAAACDSEFIVFVDADIVVPADTFERLDHGFQGHEEVVAIWGTVTAAHPHPGVVSQYKNLTHRHFTLQQDQTTRHLTTMLAAVRRDAFARVGGFDTRMKTVSVEDVELGRSLYESGGVVWVDVELAAEHRHRFTFFGAIRNDFHKARCMARTTLVRRWRGEAAVAVEGAGERRQVHYLVGVPLGAGAVGAALLGRWRLSAVLTGALLLWERELFGYLASQGGWTFATACVPLMAIERANVACAVVVGAADAVRSRVPRASAAASVTAPTSAAAG